MRQIDIKIGEDNNRGWSTCAYVFENDNSFGLRICYGGGSDGPIASIENKYVNVIYFGEASDKLFALKALVRTSNSDPVSRNAALATIKSFMIDAVNENFGVFELVQKVREISLEEGIRVGRLQKVKEIREVLSDG